MKHIYFTATMVSYLIIFSISPKGTAFATSIGEGYLNLESSISYDANTIDWSYKNGTLETWAVAQINTQNPFELLAHDAPDGRDSYPYQPGWEGEPSVSISYLDSLVNLTTDHSDTLSPTSSNTVRASSVGAPDTSIQVSSQINYYNYLSATGSGSFTYNIDFNGYWTGSTTSLNDYLSIYPNVQISVDRILADGQYGPTVGSAYSWDIPLSGLTLEGEASGVIDDFFGTLSVTIDYVAGDRFHLLGHGTNAMTVYSQDSGSSEPIPEPATLILFGTGLSGLIGARLRKRK